MGADLLQVVRFRTDDGWKQMTTRQQITRIEMRINALAAGSLTRRIIVVGPGETNEQALRREGISDRMLHQHIFVHTGVPRPEGPRQW